MPEIWFSSLSPEIHFFNYFINFSLYFSSVLICLWNYKLDIPSNASIISFPYMPWISDNLVFYSYNAALKCWFSGSSIYWSPQTFLCQLSELLDRIVVVARIFYGFYLKFMSTEIFLKLLFISSNIIMLCLLLIHLHIWFNNDVMKFQDHILVLLLHMQTMQALRHRTRAVCVAVARHSPPAAY